MDRAYPERVSPTEVGGVLRSRQDDHRQSSTLAFSKPFFQGGLLTRRAVLRSAYANFMFAVSGADHDQLEKMRAYLTQMVAGWDVETVRQFVSETLHTIIDPLVFDEAVHLIEEHQAAGRDVVIVSASGSEVVEPIGAMLGVDHVIATTLVGETAGTPARSTSTPTDPTRRRRCEDAPSGATTWPSYAYSDSETDAPMLAAVGHPYAVNPDKTLRALAVANDWPILVFDRPVALRSRLSLDTQSARRQLPLWSQVRSAPSRCRGVAPQAPRRA